MAEGDKPLDLQLGLEQGEEALGFVTNEMQGQGSRVGIGQAETQAVVGDHLVPRGQAELLWEISPQLDATKGIVEENDRRFCRLLRSFGEPAAHKEPPTGGIDPKRFRMDKTRH
ncbi:hypothetical protein D3C86_1500360 [compost metagenome]